MTVYERAVVTCTRAPRVALNGGALLPAFADTHLHFMSHALFAGGAARRDAVVIGFGASAQGHRGPAAPAGRKALPRRPGAGERERPVRRPQSAGRV